MHLLSPRVHGFIDYVLVLALALSPPLFGFVGAPAMACWVLAATVLGMSLLTAYPLGVKHVIPFTAHGAIELATTPVVIVAPWLFGFAGQDVARTYFVVVGVALGVVYLATNYRAADAYRDRSTLGGPHHA